MATATNGTLNGKPSSAECSLSKWIFSGYFANENGEKIDKINFGTKVRFYIDSHCKYNAKIKFHIKSKSVNPPLIQPNVDISVKEATVKELTPSAIVDDKRYVEIQLKKRNEYKSLSTDGDYELCCSVTDGLICFIPQDDVAKIDIGQYAIIFPLLIKPSNDIGNLFAKNYYWGDTQGSNQASYMSNRAGNRKHAARDLYTPPKTDVIAIADGVVMNTGLFYAGTNQITIKHNTIDGREFIIRYGELDPASIAVTKGNKVTQGQTLGVTGKLVGITVISGHNIYMLHFEYFINSKSTLPLTDVNRLPTQRREDVREPLSILQEGYDNTFK